MEKKMTVRCDCDLERFMPLPEGEEQYSLDYIDRFSVVKLCESEDSVGIGICDPENRSLMESLRNYHRKEPVFFHISKTELKAFLGRKLSSETSGKNTDRAKRPEHIHLDELANDAPNVNLVNSICMDAVRAGASDIHIEAFSDEVLIRYRIDGMLVPSGRIERHRFPAVSSRIKIMAQLDIMEQRLPQDGRFTMNFGSASIDVRVSIVPVAHGESIVLRLFNESVSRLSLPELGFSSSGLKILKKLIGCTHGLILVTGPTGSGKTTTLYAIIRELTSDAVKIITIEDPVEYVIRGVNQIQTNDKIHLGFDTLLQRILRQDPDVILVGEIRDTGTAELTVRAALTGHLVLSTLHTNDSVSVVDRLRNMGIESYLIASVLRGTVAQRLVRKLCPACKKAREPLDRETEELHKFGLHAETLFSGTGCSACSHAGYKGRTGIFEVFAMDDATETIIASGFGKQELRSYLVRHGMETLAFAGFKKAAHGETSMEEVLKEVPF